MKRVVVLGSRGMAGHVMYEYLKSVDGIYVVGVARSEGEQVDHVLDVTDFATLSFMLAQIKPDFVVNCIGVLVSASNENISNAILINSYLPHYLVSEANVLGFKLIHVSTDCVFSGCDGSYTEQSFRDGDDNYGRSKALGEVDQTGHLTLRTSIIGPELKSNGTGLMHWFFGQYNSISGYSKAYWSGVTTLELARVTEHAIKKGIDGLIQVSPGRKISKYELLKLINEIWDRGVKIIENTDYAVDKSLVSTRADFRYAVPGFRKMLKDMKRWTDANIKHYRHYRF